MSTIYSFDVFDTCLTRIYLRPVDLFYSLGQHIAISSGFREPDDWAAQFATQRVLAERKARKCSQKNDITHYEILNQFNWIEQFGLNPHYVLEEEKKFERKSLRPIFSIQKKIDELRSQGNRIAFISDMYLPSNFIREILQEHGFFLNEDRLYVSESYGENKASGKLFRLVCNDLCINYQQLTHTGDNYRSDCSVPKKIGVMAELFADIHYTKIEKFWLKHVDFSKKGNAISTIGGSCRASRLMGYGLSFDPHLVDLISGVIAPFLLSFVYWVLNQAEKDGVKKLYFLSSNGQIMHSIAEKLSTSFKGVKCRYLYGSRQAWYLPSVFEACKKELSWMFENQEKKSLNACLKILSLNKSDIKTKELKNLATSLEGISNCVENPRFWSLIENPSIKSLIEDNASEKRKVFVNYLKQEGLLGSKDWAIVDSGPFLSCQRALFSVISSVSEIPSVSGYYMAVERGHADAKLVGKCKGYLTQHDTINSGPNDLSSWIFKQGVMTLIETIFTPADHPTVLEYEECPTGNIVPILKGSGDQQKVKQLAQTSNKIISHFLDNLDTTFMDDEKVMQHLYSLSCKLAKSTIEEPNPDHVRALNTYNYMSAQSHESTDAPSLACPFTLYEVVSNFFFKKENINCIRHWNAGSVAISNNLIRSMYWLYRRIK